MARIVLNMIVRDEASNIVRCFESVKNIITDIVIHDTGSEDNTVEIMQNYMKENNIPGLIASRKWESFAPNRTYAFEEACKYMEKTDPDNKLIWYSLIMDADDQIFKLGPKDELTREKATLIDELGKDSYLILRKRITAIHRFQCLIRLHFDKNKRWDYHRRRHEFPEKIGNWASVEGEIKSFYILSGHEGFRAKNKYTFIEDACELLKDFADLGDMRSAYYVGQSFRDCDHRPLEKEMYKKVLSLEGYYQYKYISLYRLGLYRFENNKYDRKTYRYLEKAYKLDGRRLEAPHCMIKLLHILGEYQNAWTLAESCIAKIGKVAANMLFAKTMIYKEDIIYEIAMSAYFVNKKDKYEQFMRQFLSVTSKEKLKEKIEKNIAKYPESIQKSYSDTLGLLDVDAVLKSNNRYLQANLLQVCQKNKAYQLGYFAGKVFLNIEAYKGIQKSIHKNFYDKYLNQQDATAGKNRIPIDMLINLAVCAYYAEDKTLSLAVNTHLLENYDLNQQRLKMVTENREFSLGNKIFTYPVEKVRQLTKQPSLYNEIALIARGDNLIEMQKVLNSFLINCTDYYLIDNYYIIYSGADKENINKFTLLYPFFKIKANITEIKERYHIILQEDILQVEKPYVEDLISILERESLSRVYINKIDGDRRKSSISVSPYYIERSKTSNLSFVGSYITRCNALKDNKIGSLPCRYSYKP